MLVADDETTNRQVLRRLLTREGCAILEASDGLEAVELFVRDRPDCVLLDVMMPGVDGIEACRRIKQASQAHFVPVIFITALYREEDLVRCIAAGGDDFIGKPVSGAVLSAKMTALERIRRLHTTVRVQSDELAQHRSRLEHEREIALNLVERIVHRDALAAPGIRTWIQPADVFHGDIVLVAQRPDQTLHILLGDFTGHGLPAATGTLPIADIFYAMTDHGCNIPEIAIELNRKLKTIMPEGLFLAGALAHLDMTESRLRLWNGGLPDLIVLRDRNGIVARGPSRHLPFGILAPDQFDDTIEDLAIAHDDRILIYTDGLIEAVSATNEMFGAGRLESLARGTEPLETLFDRLLAGHDAFRAGVPLPDDITVIEVRCAAATRAGFSASPGITPHVVEPMPWQMSLQLEAAAIRTVDPLPLLLRTLIQLQGLHDHREAIYTILAEMYTNALDHGLLGLDSQLKGTPAGFAQYYIKRQKALSALASGAITLSLRHTPESDGGSLLVRVEDSGAGFTKPGTDAAANERPSGRGLKLVQSLCREVRWNEAGNAIEAVFAWQPGHRGQRARHVNSQENPDT